MKGDLLLFLKGATIDRITFDYAVTLHFDNHAELRIETPLSISSPPGSLVELDPESAAPGAAAVLHLLHQTLNAAAADEQTGDLRLEITGGTNVLVPHHSSYESWTFSAPGGDRLVALPGGGLTIWGMENQAQ